MEKEIKNCIDVLKKGGLILYPTDTVWGIGCDATNSEAIKKIYALKNRDDAKSLITLVCNDAMLNKQVHDVPELAWDIIDLATKPTTIVYPMAKNIAPNAIASDGSVAIRMIKEKFCNTLIYKFNQPIISTSANISGYPTPTHFDEIHPQIIEHVDYVVNKELDNGTQKPSAIIKLSNNGESNDDLIST